MDERLFVRIVIIMFKRNREMFPMTAKYLIILKKEGSMKKIVKATAAVSFGVMLAAGAVFAGPTDDPGIQKREQRQEKRIDQGVKSGELTPKEAGKLEAEQAKIKQDEAKMKADGKLSKEERKQLHREQNRASRDIYKKKHNKRKAE